MALFHDPLDDLIAGLERAVPASVAPSSTDADVTDWRLVDVQRAVRIVLTSSADVDPWTDPLVCEVREQIARRLIQARRNA